MIQGLIAIILLILAAALYFWGWRRPAAKLPHSDPDVVLGLTESPKSPAPPAAVEPVKPAPQSKQPLERQILFLRAPFGRQYSGYELLQSLLSCGLRFGEHKFFHRYEEQGETVSLFTVAAATKTGELDPSNMGSFACSGLSLFLTLNQHLYPSVNFELMLDTARQLADDLGGQVLDETQTILTAEKIQQMRDKIKAFETSQQTMELFV
jgi:cell division protein ZipA